MKITANLLTALGVAARNAALYAQPLNMAAVRWGIDTPARVAAWLAQLAHESRALSVVVENLNYSAQGLANTWPARYRGGSGRPNATALRIAHRPADIANLTYAGRMGNGSAGTGDGWRYRGRGLIQITGRDNYRQCGAALGLDLLAAPETLEAPLYAALSAGWYWHSHTLNPLADRGDVQAITRRINGGLVGLEDRLALHRAAVAVLTA